MNLYKCGGYKVDIPKKVTVIKRAIAHTKGLVYLLQFVVYHPGYKI